MKTMNSYLKKKLLIIINYIYALSILYLAVFSLILVLKIISEGLSHLEIRVNKLPYIIGIPVCVLILTRVLSKKLSNGK